jgi:hypothetical protein
VPIKVVYDIFNRINTGGTILETPREFDHLLDLSLRGKRAESWGKSYLVALPNEVIGYDQTITSCLQY